MINNAMQVIFCFQFKLVCHKVYVSDELAHVKISNGEVNGSLQLSPLSAILTEAFQLYDQDWWRSHDFHTLEVDLRSFAFFASSLIFQLLGFMELLKTLIECCIVYWLSIIGSSFFCGNVLYYFVCSLIIIICKKTGMPFNSHKCLLVEIIFKDWSICWFNNATTTFLSPMTKTTSVPTTIDCLQDKRLVNTITTCNKLFPIFQLPPAVCRYVVLRGGSQESMCCSPDFIIYSPAAWKFGQKDYIRSRDELGLIFGKEGCFLVHPSSVVQYYYNIIWKFRSNIVCISAECYLIKDFELVLLSHWPSPSVSVLT